MTAPAALESVVLVHGGFVDGSGWEDVYKALRKDGYPVSIVQNPTVSLADDVAATRRVMDAQSAPVILVGHSYGGVVITEAGNHPKVAGLVYIAAFAPDAGESVSSLIKDPPPGAPVPPIVPAGEGFLGLEKARFRESFAADVDADKAAFMADSQVPWGVERSRARGRGEPLGLCLQGEGRRRPDRAGGQDGESLGEVRVTQHGGGPGDRPL